MFETHAKYGGLRDHEVLFLTLPGAEIYSAFCTTPHVLEQLELSEFKEGEDVVFTFELEQNWTVIEGNQHSETLVTVTSIKRA